MLKIIKHIETFGLEKTVEKFKLKSKDYTHKVLIKYDQIASDMSLIEVQESRGLVLEKDTWDIMSMSFYKFFNSAETHAAKIDWSTALILQKLDGSLCTTYFDWILNKWCVCTTGTAEGEGEVNNKFGTTFADLFWNTVGGYDIFTEKLDKLGRKNTYMFELCTPYNIVVKPHSSSSATLLAVRNLKDLSELSREEVVKASIMLGVNVVKIFDINATNTGHVIKTLEGMPYTEEGYVVVDANFNRIKIKNPAYVAAHGLKNRTAEYRIVEIVKTNEIEEFGAVFPERKDEIFALKKSYDALREDLYKTWEILKGFLPKNITKAETKKYAMKVFEVSKQNSVEDYTGLFFSLKDGKIDTIDHYLMNLDNKRLYKALEIKM